MTNTEMALMANVAVDMQNKEVIGVLQEIREEISHITDMEVVRGGLYVREFEVAEIIDKHIKQYMEE